MKGVYVEACYIEFNLKKKKKKWLVCCSYNPRKISIKNHSKVLHFSCCNDLIALELFNVRISNNDIKDFYSNYSSKYLIIFPSCYKNLCNHLYIDLALANTPKRFQRSCATEKSLSDFCKMTITIVDPPIIN